MERRELSRELILRAKRNEKKIRGLKVCVRRGLNEFGLLLLFLRKSAEGGPAREPGSCFYSPACVRESCVRSSGVDILECVFGEQGKRKGAISRTNEKRESARLNSQLAPSTTHLPQSLSNGSFHCGQHNGQCEVTDSVIVFQFPLEFSKVQRPNLAEFFI